MKKNKLNIVELIKEEYSSRITELYREAVKDIFEADMFDAEGNQLLSPGLKVRHKKSGYEYTVDHVEGDGDNAVVFLRHPEVGRFKPPEAETQLAEGDEEETRIDVNQVDLQKISGDASVLSQESPTATQDPMDTMKQMNKGSLLKIDKKEYEKEYEVK